MRTDARYELSMLQELHMLNQKRTRTTNRECAHDLDNIVFKL